MTINQYNLLLYSPAFYDKIKTEHFLIFQSDTLISDINAKNIYDYIKYDYVGAPWHKVNDYEAVGNGGFSLRRKDKMIEMIKNGGYLHPNGQAHYEDRFFSDTCGNKNKITLYKPSLDIAKNFAVETIYNKTSVGLHKPWLYLNPTQINELSQTFFDLKQLINLHK